VNLLLYSIRLKNNAVCLLLCLSLAMEACPLDPRRGVTEVFIKRLAVLFAALCREGHLNSLRGMKGSSQLLRSLLLVYINPVYPLCLINLVLDAQFFKARSDTSAEYTIVGH
jgi:hypothetical protein